MEGEANNISQETELDGTIVELNGEVDSVTDRQVGGHSDSSNDVIISANQFHEFMSTVLKEFDDLKARMRSVADEMSTKIEIANKNLSKSLTKQFREENDSLKKEFSSKLKSEISNLTEAMNQLRKGYKSWSQCGNCT